MQICSSEDREESVTWYLIHEDGETVEKKEGRQQDVWKSMGGVLHFVGGLHSRGVYLLTRRYGPDSAEEEDPEKCENCLHALIPSLFHEIPYGKVAVIASDENGQERDVTDSEIRYIISPRGSLAEL